MKTPMSILRENEVDGLDWNYIYSHRNTLSVEQKKIYDKVWPKMQDCFEELETLVLTGNPKETNTNAIMAILRTYCPEVYALSQSNALSSLSAQDRKDRHNKLTKLVNESQVKF